MPRKPALDLTGQKFGRLLVQSLSHITSAKCRQWNCLCDCGSSTVASTSSLRHGSTASCGCLAIENCSKLGKKAKTHGQSWMQNQTSEYTTWKAMRQRCYQISSPSYKNYGAKGINVCDSWRLSFQNFFTDMGPKPSKSHTLNRIDSSGNYGPDNCEWVTWHEQSRNRNDTVLLTYKGKTQCVTDWSKELGITTGAIRYRLSKNFPLEKVFAK